MDGSKYTLAYFACLIVDKDRWHILEVHRLLLTGPAIDAVDESVLFLVVSVSFRT